MKEQINKPRLFVSYILPLVSSMVIIALFAILFFLIFKNNIFVSLIFMFLLGILFFIEFVALTTVYLLRYFKYETNINPNGELNIPAIVGCSVVAFGVLWSMIPWIGIMGIFFIIGGFITSIVAIYIHKPGMRGKGFANIGVTIGAYYIIALLIAIIIAIFAVAFLINSIPKVTPVV